MKGKTMILNLTQHKATPEQIEAGVVDLPENLRQDLIRLLTFDDLPNYGQVKDRANDICRLACNFMEDYYNHSTMIGGAPFLMPFLHDFLHLDYCIRPVYAFSKRESVEEIQPDGSVKKTQIFRHQGFVGMPINEMNE